MRKFTLLLAAFACSLFLVGCGAMSGSSSNEPPRGSLTKTYQLLDEDGRMSGTLVLQPMGRAELRDSDGKLIGVFSAEQGFNPQMSN